MKISTKGRYGLRAMLDMAVNPLEEYTPLNIIAERQNISGNYLEQVFALLKRAGLVKSIRGSQGGYALSRNPSKITVGEILRALEGELSITISSYKDRDDCSKIETSINTVVWEKVNTSINTAIDSITLEHLVEEYNSFNKLYTLDFVI